MTSVLIKEDIWRQACTQGEHHVIMKAEIGVMLPEVPEVVSRN